MWVMATALLGGILVLLLRGLHDQEQILRDWEMVLAPWGTDVCEELEERLGGESRMVEHAYQRAFSAKAAGSTAEAIRLLDVGLRVVERTSPSMITLLRGMAVVSRMAAAVAPVSPLGPGMFRVRRLASLATLAHVLHHLLVSTAERFRLRAYVLRRGFGVVTRFMFRTTERIRASRVSTDPDWNRIASARADLRTLSSESLQTFRALVTSLTAQLR